MIVFELEGINATAEHERSRRLAQVIFVHENTPCLLVVLAANDWLALARQAIE